MKGLWRRVAAFIAGFTLVYVVLGVSVAFVGSFLKVHMNWLFGIAGLILIIFGLHVARLIRIPFLETQVGGMDKAKDPRNFIGAFMVGIAFAIGWSPCTGPILAAILTLAMSQDTVFAGGILLLCFCIGLGVPFLLTALAVNYFLKIFDKVLVHMRKVEIASSILLILIGLLMITSALNIIGLLNELRGVSGISTIGLEKWLKGLMFTEDSGITLMAAVVAAFAGLLSFISPCVLPLLPSYIAFIAGTTDVDDLSGESQAKV